jgi:multidrug transporter EmrE-like cation transporter
VLIPLASIHVFGEQVRPLHVAGIILIAAGIACVLADG